MRAILVDKYGFEKKIVIKAKVGVIHYPVLGIGTIDFDFIAQTKKGVLLYKQLK